MARTRSTAARSGDSTRTTPVPARVRAVADLRRSSAASPHRNAKRYHRPSAARALRSQEV